MSDFSRWWLGIRELPAGSEGLRFAWEHDVPGWIWLVVVLGCVLVAAWSYSRIDAPQRMRILLAAARVSILLLLATVRPARSPFQENVLPRFQRLCSILRIREIPMT